MILKAGTHEGACSRSTLLQHAPGAKLPRLHQRFLAKKICCATKLKLPSFAPSYQTGLMWGSNLQGQICCTSLFRTKLPRVYWHLLCGSVFQEQARSCVLVGVLTRERVSRACLRSKLLRVYWLEYLPGFRSGTCFRSKLPRVYRP